MMSPLTLVQKTTTMLTPAFNNLPTPVWALFRTFQWVHLAWHGSRVLKAHTNPESYFSIAVSHGADRLANALGAQELAFWILIAERVLQCAEQTKAVANAWNQVCDAARGTYIQPRKHEWIDQDSALVSPSTKMWLLSMKSATYDRVSQFCRALFVNLLWEIGQLSMRVLDVVSPFSLTTKEVCPFNTLALDIANNGNLLLFVKLEANKEMVTSHLQSFGSPYTCEELLAAALPIVKVAKAADSVGTSFFGSMVKSGLCFIGMENQIPAGCVQKPQKPRNDSRFDVNMLYVNAGKQAPVLVQNGLGLEPVKAL